jgi:hypothetical protein
VVCHRSGASRSAAGFRRSGIRGPRDAHSIGFLARPPARFGPGACRGNQPRLHRLLRRPANRPSAEHMRCNIADGLGCDHHRINVKRKTHAGFGPGAEERQTRTRFSCSSEPANAVTTPACYGQARGEQCNSGACSRSYPFALGLAVRGDALRVDRRAPRLPRRCSPRRPCRPSSSCPSSPAATRSASVSMRSIRKVLETVATTFQVPFKYFAHSTEPPYFSQRTFSGKKIP